MNAEDRKRLRGLCDAANGSIGPATWREYLGGGMGPVGTFIDSVNPDVVRHLLDLAEECEAWRKAEDDFRRNDPRTSTEITAGARRLRAANEAREREDR